ncbi:MAG TPA: SIMPL domain-containing protein [Candidatus Paceibacterota bacterium]
MFNQFFGEEGAKRISKWLAISLVLFSAFLLVKVLGEFKKLPNIGKEIYPQSTIMVTGSGEAYAIPDVASFNFTVTEVGDTVSQAQEKLDQKINKSLAAIKEAGVEDRDIKTINYNVYPKYEWEQIYCITTPCPQGKNTLVGYEVSQTVSVKVRDTEKAADLVTEVGAADVSNISGLEFTVDDRDKYVAEAREQAIAEAKEKAKVLAKQLGVRLGDIIYYNDNSDYPAPYYAEGMGGADMIKSVSAMAPARAELPTGESKITANISITYEIK